MAEPKNTKPIYGFGHLNPRGVSNNIRYFDPESDVLDILARSVSGESKPNTLLNLNNLKGIVLRKDGPSTTSTSKNLGNSGKVLRQSLKVRIPELHSHLPDPLQYGNNLGCFQQITEMYPSFEGSDDVQEEITTINPGDIVYVRFEDPENMEGPVFVGLCQKGPGGCAGDVSGEAKGAFDLPLDLNDPIEAARAQEILDTRLSTNFIVSDLASAGRTALANINRNIPNEAAIENMRALAENILEPIFENYNTKPQINSGYRGSHVNKIVGGSPNSQHSRGQAADIEVDGVSNLQLALWIKDNLDYDQLILEDAERNNDNAGWVHVSFSNRRNKKQDLSTHKKITKIKTSNGKIKRVRDYKPGIQILV